MVRLKRTCLGSTPRRPARFDTAFDLPFVRLRTWLSMLVMGTVHNLSLRCLVLANGT